MFHLWFPPALLAVELLAQFFPFSFIFLKLVMFSWGQRLFPSQHPGCSWLPAPAGAGDHHESSSLAMEVLPVMVTRSWSASRGLGTDRLQGHLPGVITLG